MAWNAVVVDYLTDAGLEEVRKLLRWAEESKEPITKAAEGALNHSPPLECDIQQAGAPRHGVSPRTGGGDEVSHQRR